MYIRMYVLHKLAAQVMHLHMWVSYFIMAAYVYMQLGDLTKVLLILIDLSCTYYALKVRVLDHRVDLQLLHVHVWQV